ncbi:MAG: hypothetical protein IKP28_03845 [Clostridia bacterium]|nr:hypothetical protein [Clostridia bacterium]
MKSSRKRDNIIFKKPKLNAKRGITLIALVITVIVLLILAGTAISMGINGDGLFSKTDNAVKKWNNQVSIENNVTNGLVTTLSTLLDKYNGVITLETMQEYIDSGEMVYIGGYYEHRDGGWADGMVYRFTETGGLYIVGHKYYYNEVWETLDYNPDADPEVGILDWDGIVTFDNNQMPIQLTTSFGTFNAYENWGYGNIPDDLMEIRFRYDESGEQVIGIDSMSVYLDSETILVYDLNGKVIKIEYAD